jgi:hypothetical protein
MDIGSGQLDYEQSKTDEERIAEAILRNHLKIFKSLVLLVNKSGLLVRLRFDGRHKLGE